MQTTVFIRTTRNKQTQWECRSRSLTYRVTWSSDGQRSGSYLELTRLRVRRFATSWTNYWKRLGVGRLSMSPQTTLEKQSSLSLLLVVVLVVVNVGQVGSWSGHGCCELTQDARCRRICLRVRVFVRVCVCVCVCVVLCPSCSSW